MSFEDFVFPVSLEQTKELALIQPEINNVIRGIKTDLCFSTFDVENKKFQNIYINYKSKYYGVMFMLRFDDPNYYNYLGDFSIQLSLEFPSLDPIQTINTYLHQVRSGLENIGVNTASIAEWKNLNTRLGDYEPEVVSPSGFEIIPFVSHKEFYQELFKIEGQLILNEALTYVYVMLNVRNGLFKIGYSKNPTHRERTLQSAEPEIILLQCWEGDKKMEKELHKCFRMKRVRGEWFELNIIDLLKIRDFTFSN